MLEYETPTYGNLNKIESFSLSVLIYLTFMYTYILNLFRGFFSFGVCSCCLVFFGSLHMSWVYIFLLFFFLLYSN